MGYITELANSIGVVEPALKLMLTVYAGYIFALLHRLLPFKTHSNLKLLCFTLTGGYMIYWNYGYDVYHSALCIVIQYFIFQTLGGSLASVLVSFAFQLGYLVYGYLFYSTAGYDINWCMPQCILTLRLIGLAFDVFDGHKQEEDVTKEQRERAIKDYPGLLEMFGFTYMYCGFLVGPQFPLQRLRSLLNGEFTDNPGRYPSTIMLGIRRGISGTLALLIQIYLSTFFYARHMTTPEYQNSGFFYKVGYMCLTSYMAFIQYISVWMVNTINPRIAVWIGFCYVGCSIIVDASGVADLGWILVSVISVAIAATFLKDEKTGEVHWDSIRNVILHKFLFARSFQDMIDSFNLNTNAWVLRYVYKRLRFIGIKEVSQTATLMFLAIWHGIHEGYFTCFSYEFLVMNAEKPMIAYLSGSGIVKMMKSNRYLSWIPWLSGFLYLKFFIGYCLLDFQLLKWNLYYPHENQVAAKEGKTSPFRKILFLFFFTYFGCSSFLLAVVSGFGPAQVFDLFLPQHPMEWNWQYLKTFRR